MTAAETAATVTYQYAGITFELTTAATEREVIAAAIRRAFPRHPYAYPERLSARDGGGFRVYEPAQGGTASRKVYGAGAVGPGRLADGTLFWPEE